MGEAVTGMIGRIVEIRPGIDDDGILPQEIMPDRLHPNERGYEIWAEAMEPAIRKMMGEK